MNHQLIPMMIEDLLPQIIVADLTRTRFMQQQQQIDISNFINSQLLDRLAQRRPPSTDSTSLPPWTPEETSPFQATTTSTKRTSGAFLKVPEILRNFDPYYPPTTEGFFNEVIEIEPWDTSIPTFTESIGVIHIDPLEEFIRPQYGILARLTPGESRPPGPVHGFSLDQSSSSTTTSSSSSTTTEFVMMSDSIEDMDEETQIAPVSNTLSSTTTDFEVSSSSSNSSSSSSTDYLLDESSSDFDMFESSTSDSIDEVESLTGEGTSTKAEWNSSSSELYSSTSSFTSFSSASNPAASTTSEVAHSTTSELYSSSSTDLEFFDETSSTEIYDESSSSKSSSSEFFEDDESSLSGSGEGLKTDEAMSSSTDVSSSSSFTDLEQSTSLQFESSSASSSSSSGDWSSSTVDADQSSSTIIPESSTSSQLDITSSSTLATSSSSSSSSVTRTESTSDDVQHQSSSSTLDEELSSSSSTDMSSTSVYSFSKFLGQSSGSDDTSSSDFISSSSTELDWLDSSTSAPYDFMSTSTSPIMETTTRGREREYLKNLRHTYMKDKSPLEALVAQADMRLLGENVKRSDKYPTLKLVGMTLFAPVDAAFDAMPFDVKSALSIAPKMNGLESARGNEERTKCLGGQSMMRPYYGYRPPNTRTSAIQSKILNDFERLIMFHVVRRQVPPGMIEAKKDLEMRTEMAGQPLPISLVESEGVIGGMSNSGNYPEVIVGDAKVLEVVHCRNGYIYKLDKPLTPSFNLNAPSLMEYVSTHPDYSKLKYLLKHSHLFDGWLSKAGPISVFLIKDDGWRINGLPVPDCFFKALIRPQNQDMLMKLLRWVTIPGLWKRHDIENSQWLINAESPALMVNHIYRPSDDLPSALSEDSSGAPTSDELVILVEGKEVVEWNIPLHNGYGHVLTELPIRPDLDLTPVLWDCLDFLCLECPIVTKYVLKWIDNGGLLPDVSNPKAYIIPNGIRPDWVCSNHRNWFPAGWEVKEWHKYLDAAKKVEQKNSVSGSRKNVRGSDDTKHVQKLAKDGWLAAARKREKLLDQYEEARVHLKRIWAYYADPQNFVLGKKEDMSGLTGFLTSHRSLEIMPKVCEPRERAFNRRHGYPQQKNEGYLADSDDNDDVGLSYDDWKYITQWI